MNAVTAISLGACRRSLFWRLLMIVLVELVDVQTATSLMHVDIGSPGGAVVTHWRLDLDGLRTIAFLSVQLTSIHRLDVHDATVTALDMVTLPVVWR